MSTPPPPQQQRRSAGDTKKATPSSTIITRNGARKAKIQTRAMSASAKPSASVVAAKKKALQKKKQVVDTIIRDQYQVAMESKMKVKGPTGFVTEPRMAEHRCFWDDNYPECPERLISVLDRCRELNLIDQCKQFEPRAASKEELLPLHSPTVYDMLEGTHRNQNVDYLEELSSKYDAIYIHPSTHELALIAAGSTIDLVGRIAKGEVQNGAAFVRPPGHHAMKSEPCGYCFYNNAALAAAHAIQNNGLSRLASLPFKSEYSAYTQLFRGIIIGNAHCITVAVGLYKRLGKILGILIVDWDVHHGQATQQMFYNDDRVVYFSIHRYEHGAFWPNLRQSNFNYVGVGKGAGYNFNVPLNATGMKNADYLAIWHQLLIPTALEGEMELTPACYATLLHMLMGVCSQVCVVLEGGYCLPSLAEGAALTLRTLLGNPPPPNSESLTEPSDSVRESILNCIYAHKPYWGCFNYQPIYSVGPTPNVCDGEKEKHTVTVKWEGDEYRPDSFATRDCYPRQDDATKKRIAERLNHLRLVTDLSLPQHAVCYVYDEIMLKHKNICEPGHVECPERVMRIHERHRDFGLLSRLHQLKGIPAPEEVLLDVHTVSHLQRLKEMASTKLRDLRRQEDSYDSIYFHPDSFESAAMAAGCVLQAVDAVLNGVAGSGVCVVRPPGHHADEEVPSGFCLLNNAAAAAKYAVRSHGLKRVLIVDWDVHHGNGTQRITYNDNKILYMSIHRYDNGTFFPKSRDADYDAVGSAPAEGYNVNVPWNKRGMGDTEYMAAFTQVILPIAYEYNPELVIVSAGFDACVGDFLGGCKVTPECYGRMTHLLRGLAGGKVVLCLEGGYNVTSISYAMTMCTKALLGDPIQHHFDPKSVCHPSAIESINNVIKTHKTYWKSLKFQLALPVENVLEEPLPSRGLDSGKISNDSFKSRSFGQLESSLESDMVNLTIDKSKCSDGIHCGTDDEDEDRTTDKSNANTWKDTDNPGCSKGVVQDGACSKDIEGKKTLVDYLSENMQALVDGDMFAVVPVPWCPHLDSLFAIPPSVKFEQGVKCAECDEKNENWVCLHCYVTACGRSVNGHMQAHYQTTEHALVLSLLDLSVWCNVCDAYVDNPLLYEAKNNAHKCKFGEDMPWCYRTDIQME